MSVRQKLLPVIYCILICGFSACNEDNKPATTQRRSAQAAVSILDTAATAGFSTLLYQYYDLKNALTFTNSAAADKAAAAMQQQVCTLRNRLPAGQDSLLQQLDTISVNLGRMLAVKDESCEVKRIYFKPVSAALYDALKHIKIKNLTIYHTFCPMAFREKGAFWLSEFPEIRNPYFGAKMIECGEVIDTLQ